MKILVVDDNSEIANSLSQFFKLQQFTCHIATGGRIALSMMKSEHYDVVFLDLHMPGFSGYDVIESLKNSNSMKIQKIIILTAMMLDDSDIKLLLKQGVHVVLQKPIPLNELISYVRLNFPVH